MTINEAIVSYWLLSQSELTRWMLKCWNVQVSYSSSNQVIVLTIDRLEHGIELVESQHLVAAGINLQVITGRLDCLRPDINWRDDCKSVHVIDRVWMDSRGSLCLRFSEQQRKIHAQRFLIDGFAQKLRVGSRKLRIYYGDTLESPYPLIVDEYGHLSVNHDFYPD